MRQGFSALVPVFSINMNDLLYCIMIHIYFHYIFFTHLHLQMVLPDNGMYDEYSFW